MYLYLFILLLIVLIYIVENKANRDKEFIEEMINIKYSEGPVLWNRNKCKYMMNNVLADLLKQYNLNKTLDNDWHLYFPCTYNDINAEIKEMTPTKDNQKIFIIHNADYLAAKNILWQSIYMKYGRNKAKQITPDTYRLYNKEDMEEFSKNYNKNKLYIMKKNIQRQEGLKITNDYNFITNNSDNYVVVQELLQNPYLIDGRKINMRFYVLVICHNGEVEFYVHNNGFMYYTRDKFIKNSLEEGPNITTGYIDRQVYEVNPLTHDDFRKYLDANRQLTNDELNIIKTHKLSKYAFDNIYKTIKDGLISLKLNICKNKKLDKSITFELFGADIALDDKLQAQIIEINKGPDLSAKDGRDKQVKVKVVSDILRIMKIIKDNEKHEFISLN